MRKKTILWLILVSIILGIIGVVIYVPSVVSAVQTCTADQIQAGTCTPSVSSSLGVGLLIAILFFIVGGILGLIAWIGALIRTAKMQTWGWFVVVLILTSLGTLIYAIAGPAERPAMAGAYPPQGYPPQYRQ